MSSPNFTLEEFLSSATADDLEINNYPTWQVVENLTRLANTMERVRAGLLNAPVTILSGYRCPEVNSSVGGASNSAHLDGLACDFVAENFGSPYDICKTLEGHLMVLQVDQLIWEFGDWVHLGLATDGAVPRYQCLTIDERGTFEGFG